MSESSVTERKLDAEKDPKEAPPSLLSSIKLPAAIANWLTPEFSQMHTVEFNLLMGSDPVKNVWKGKREPKMSFTAFGKRCGGEWKDNTYVIGSGGAVRLAFIDATGALFDPRDVLCDGAYWRKSLLDLPGHLVTYWPNIYILAQQTFRRKLWPDGRNSEQRERDKEITEIAIPFGEWTKREGPTYEVSLDALFIDKHGRPQEEYPLYSSARSLCPWKHYDHYYDYEKQIPVSLSITYGIEGPYTLRKRVTQPLFTFADVVAGAKAAV